MEVDPTGFLQEGYDKYCKTQKTPFVMPSINEGDEVLVPKEHIHEVLMAKETDLSFKAHIIDFFQLQYTGQASSFMTKYELFVKLIQHDLTDMLKSVPVAEALSHEARQCLEDYWGRDVDNWIEVPLQATVEKMSARMINVLGVGVAMSRDDILIDAMIQNSNLIVIGSNIIKVFPDFLRPIIGPVVALLNRWHEWVIDKRLRPLIELKLKKKRESMNQREYQNQSKSTQELKTETFLDILIEDAIKRNWSASLTTKWLSHRVFMLNFPGVHTTSMSGCSFLMDILSCPPEHEIIETLRNEVQTIKHSTDGTWTVADLERATLLDSSIKESLRLHGLSALNPSRRVVAKEGFTLSSGLFLPYGTNIGIPQYSIHRDSDIYPLPNEYQPFRFFCPTASAEERPQIRMTTTSEKFISFGHGRRHCVGRWIFAYVWKMLVAEMLLNYDIKPIDSRPAITRFGRFQVPNNSFTITVRRKAT